VTLRGSWGPAAAYQAILSISPPGEDVVADQESEAAAKQSEAAVAAAAAATHTRQSQ